MTVHSFSTQ